MADERKEVFTENTDNTNILFASASGTNVSDELIITEKENKVINRNKPWRLVIRRNISNG